MVQYRDVQSVITEYSPVRIDTDTLTGDAEERVQSVIGNQFEHCSSTHMITKHRIYAYGHDGGIELANGDKVWLTVRCPTCGYDLSEQHWDRCTF